MLRAIGRCGERAVPGVRADLEQKMSAVEGSLIGPVRPGAVMKARERAQEELSEWAERAFTHHKDTEKDLREIVLVVTATAQSLGERDDRYANQLGELSGRLGTIAQGTDVSQMRQSILESTRALKTCVEHMREESQATVDHLTAEVREYRRRLEEAEHASNCDHLTQLANRRAFERELGIRIGRAAPFSLILVDLDGFKGVNDRYGHPAGDELLQQFAAELKGVFPKGDLVARLGGDEFAAVTAGNFELAQLYVDRIRNWVLGEYKLACGVVLVKVQLGASIGAGEWQGGESSAEFVARVDAAVYRNKQPRERFG